MKPKSRPAAKLKLDATEMEVLMRKVGAATSEAVVGFPYHGACCYEGSRLHVHTLVM